MPALLATCTMDTKLVKASPWLSAAKLGYSTIKSCRKDIVNLQLLPDYVHVYVQSVHSVNPTQ